MQRSLARVADLPIPSNSRKEIPTMKRSRPLIIAALSLLALTGAVMAQQNEAAPDPLVRLLRSKGIITEQEAATISEAATSGELQQRLAKLLLSKGVITDGEYSDTIAALGATSAPGTDASRLQTAAAHSNDRVNSNQPLAAANVPAVRTGAVASAAAQAAQEPKVVPAVAPLRVLPITIPKKEGLLPDIKLGSGAKLRPYGFFKVSAVEQTASHGGRVFGSNDFPQGPLLLGDTGPDADPQFHIKDRAMRLGVDFEWPDIAKKLTLTGKLEIDFEGNFTNVNNRNISANRSSQPSLRLAWVRLDTRLGDMPVFVQFGQDWSIFGSSTLMDLFETTGFGFAQGNLYERMPMFRAGVQFGKGDFKFQPEFAIALPSFGEPALDVDQRTRFGGRVGPESNQPELQARLVFQFPLSHAPGVAPAQIIFSADHAQRAEIVEAGSLPVGPIRSAFPTGLRLTSNRNAWSAEMQLPTPFVTIVGKYYRGGDLRYYFMGQFNDVFTDLGGATPIVTATPILSEAGRAIPFGTRNGAVVAASLEPVIGQGGFVQLGFPLSRIFGAEPGTRAAGWTFYLTYGLDSAVARDTARANGLLRTDHGSAQLRYKINQWVSFVDEVTYLDTRTVGSTTKLFRGVPVHVAHAWRNEFGTIFTF
jgi:hypothetical protein